MLRMMLFLLPSYLLFQKLEMELDVKKALSSLGSVDSGDRCALRAVAANTKVLVVGTCAGTVFKVGQ